MNGQGFNKLTEEEYIVLSAFPEDKEIGFPVDCGFSKEQTINILKSLSKKNSIVGKAPYRLTKKGLKEIQEWRTTTNQ
jgi:dihydropteroate synthase